MQPQPLDSARASRRERSGLDALRSALGPIADVRAPGEAEEPILAPAVRRAVHGWLVEINNAAELAAVGLKPRATALLFGPPGVGKTTLAHHLAARLGIPLVNVGAEGILGKWLGEAEKNMARLFDALEGAETRCVVFLDELDGLGAKRSEDAGGGAQHARNSTLNVLLRRVEQYDGILIGATNLAAMLDPALWRRFGMQIDVALPGEDERFAILRRYGLPFDFGDDALDLLTELTAGAPPSLLRQLMEGVKRLLVVGERLGYRVDDPAATFGAIVAETKPHPDYKPPPLWADPRGADELRGFPWPPARG